MALLATNSPSESDQLPFNLKQAATLNRRKIQTFRQLRGLWDENGPVFGLEALPETTVLQLAEHIATQRGEPWQRWRSPRRTAYARALEQRMREIRAHLQREITGADLYQTMNTPQNTPYPSSWEHASPQERELYDAVVQHFMNQQDGE